MSSGRNREGDEAAASRMQPPKDERNFLNFLWNPETKTVMGRSAKSWARIGIFYIVFYSFLAGFFSIMMAIFYQTLNYDAPKYTGKDSLLVNPGLGFRPRTFGPDDLRPTITYDPSNPESYAFYVDSMKKYWKPYTSPHPRAIDCQPSDGYREEGDPVCLFKMEDLNTLNTTCNPANLWGYNTTSPCILLKLNKIFHWKPEPLDSLDSLPKGLQQHINESGNPEELLKQNVWVWCESEDVEMKQPSPALPLRYFPYRRQEGYVAPFVPVQLLDLPVDQKVEVQCRVWASNVKHRINYRKISEQVIFVHII